MRNFGSWKDYAIARLSEYRNKSQILLFQTGNTSNGETLFSSANSVHFMADIVKQSGWKVLSVGSPRPDHADYVQHSYDQLNRATTYKCRQNKSSSLVDYFIGDDLCGSSITGLAAKPILLPNQR